MKEQIHELMTIIPKEQMNEVFSSGCCELDCFFMGFTDIYKGVLDIADTGKTIIDLGCYVAAQSYYFKEYTRYIGVDPLPMSEQPDQDTIWCKRFHTENTVHYVASAQEFITDIFPDLGIDKQDCMVIMSYVPSCTAMEMAIDFFDNIRVYYPDCMDGCGYDYLFYDGICFNPKRKRWDNKD